VICGDLSRLLVVRQEMKQVSKKKGPSLLASALSSASPPPPVVIKHDMVVPVCVPNTKETDGDEFVSILSPEEALEEFKRLRLDIAVKNPRSGGMALEDMKMVAKLCGISSNLKKQAMAESINTHLCNRAKLLPYVFADKQPLRSSRRTKTVFQDFATSCSVNTRMSLRNQA
jgi:hypothetical protein